MFNLKGRVVVISGASSGLGRQMSEAFARQGADVAILARRLEKLEDLKEELKDLNVEVLPVKCDVTNIDSINEAKKVILDKFKKVDILVNCAGSSKNNGVLNMTDEEWNFTMDADLNSVFYMTRAFAPIMKENNYGRIINIA